MNKKVVLSVLSATFVASMAASAFAAPNSGLYIGGNVKHFYSFDNLIGLSSAGLAQYKADMAAIGTDFDNLVYVALDGKGASVSEILAASSLEDATKDPLKKDDFADVYSTIDKDGKVAGTYDARANVDGDDTPGELKVESVSAINAIQLEVKFGAAVDEDSAEDVTNYTIQGTQLSTPDKAVLSEDGKTVTLTLNNYGALTNKNAYSVEVDGVKGTDGTAVPKYTTSFVQNDATVADVVSVEAKAGSAGTKTFKVKFSEPVAAAGSVYVDGQAATVSTLSSTDASLNKEITVTTSQTLAAGSTHTVRVASFTDYAGNVLVSKEVSFTVEGDTTAGKFVSATPVSEDVIKLTFDKEVDPATIPGATNGTTFTLTKLGGTWTGSAVIDPDDAKSVLVTVNTPGYSSTVTSISPYVTLKGLKDVNGNTIEDVVDRQVTLTADTTKPAFVKATVAADNQSVLVEFSEELANATVTNADASALTVVNSEGVDVTGSVFGAGQGFDRATIVDAKGVAAAPGTDTKYIKFANAGGNTLAKGTYTVTLPASSVTDTALAANANDTVQFTFTVNDLGNTTPITAAVANETVNPNGTYSFEVNFGTVVNDTARNTANYTIDGQALPAGSSIVFTSTTKDTVRVTLPAGTFTADATKKLAVMNVENSAGTRMTAPQLLNINVLDNTKPTLVKAEATADNTLVLTFSEPVTLVDADGGAGAELTIGSWTYDANVAGDGAATSELNNVVTLTKAGLGAEDLADTDLVIAAGAFADKSGNTNGIAAITDGTVADKFAIAPTAVVGNHGTNDDENGAEITIDITEDANAATDIAAKYDIYITAASAPNLSTVADVEAQLTKLVSWDAAVDAAKLNTATALPGTIATLSDGTAVATFNGDVDIYVVVTDKAGNKALFADTTTVEAINVAD
ncbi:beta strand repeat-containing protein [Brevibacillus sp. GCM10020057]|uniref:beta strand repeat-containing protein n=1 Tax=Brevibacillus sp. GCM10020057 TaxID=3317327 RepID=UPI00364297AB